MPGLQDTIRGLRTRGGPTEPGSSGPDGGMAEVGAFGPNPGELRMLAYLPDGLAAGAPLVVVLHGCQQRAGAYVQAAGWLTLADRLGFAVLAPEQGSHNNPNRCFNWFEPADTTRGAGEAASIKAMIEHLLAAHDLDASRVFITGLSAGGAMASVLLATYPETFAAGAVIAGLPYGVAKDVNSALSAMRGRVPLDSRGLADVVVAAAPSPASRPRLTVWQGLADTTVASVNALALARQAAAVHGLGEDPDQVQTRPGWVRSVWRAPSGEALVELNLLAALGHGVPLAAGGDDPLGEPGAFLLEAGVSSSLEIARFWGLASPEGEETDWSSGPPADAAAPTVGDTVLAALSPHVSGDIAKVIADAFRAAGLSR